MCELKSQSREHLAYTERLKLHNSFGPMEAAACRPALILQCSHFFAPGLMKSTWEGKFVWVTANLHAAASMATYSLG